MVFIAFNVIYRFLFFHISFFFVSFLSFSFCIEFWCQFCFAIFPRMFFSTHLQHTYHSHTITILLLLCWAFEKRTLNILQSVVVGHKDLNTFAHCAHTYTQTMMMMMMLMLTEKYTIRFCVAYDTQLYIMRKR